jgi:hypothetical protein
MGEIERGWGIVMLADLRITLFYLFSFSAGLDSMRGEGGGRREVDREERGGPCVAVCSVEKWDLYSVCLCAAREAGGDV